MEDLIDIEGLDLISWWPLALGWWLVLASLILIFTLAIYFTVKHFKYRRSWQWKSFTRLNKLQTDLSVGKSKEVIAGLSMEMRKIAMQTTNRETCAALSGKQWLAWLEEHDPRGYKWRTNGKLLTDVQYMPDLEINDKALVEELIHAARQWVKKC